MDGSLGPSSSPGSGSVRDSDGPSKPPEEHLFTCKITHTEGQVAQRAWQ